MIRTPHEPADSMLRMQLGHATPKPANKPPVAPPFTEYTAIKNRPGWEDDGYGHLRYNGLPDAMKHERAEVDKERAVKESLAAFTRLEGGSNDVQLVKESLAAIATTSVRALAAAIDWSTHPNCRCATPAEFAEQYQLKPFVPIPPEMQAGGFRLSDGNYLTDGVVRSSDGFEYTLQHRRIVRSTRVTPKHKPSVILKRMFTLNPGVLGFECTHGGSFFTEPIYGVTVTLHDGDDCGRGLLVTFDRDPLIAADKLHTVRPYIRGLRECMPADVPLFVKNVVGKIIVWTKDRQTVPIIRG